MNSKIIRFSLVITAFWLVLGGLWSYMRNAADYREYYSNVEYVCANSTLEQGPTGECVDKKMDEFNAKLGAVGYWNDIYIQIFIELAAGAIIIWAIALGSRWAMKDKH